MSDDLEFEMPNRGDDRPGLDELDELDELDDGDDEEDAEADDAEDDDAEDDDEEDADEEDDYPEDAGEEDIDLVVALYREDGQAVAVPLEYDLANDLEALIAQLRRIPGDGGAVGLVSIASEVFVIVRVRGKHVQVFCSDAVAANDWPLARDVVDLLGVEAPEDSEDEDGYPVGDLDILADAGLHDFELEALAEDYEEDATTLVERIATRIKFGPEFSKAVAAFR